MQTTLETLSDAEIIRQVVEGDIDRFELLLEKYQNYVLTIVKKHVPYEQIEETTHEVFVRAYQSLPTFRNEGNFQQWLASIAVRTCHDFWRKQYRNREMVVSSLSEKQQHWIEHITSRQAQQSFEAEDEQQAAKDVLDWALSRLSPEDKMVIELVYLEELSGKEAAKLLGWSVANVKVRSFRARKKLQKLLRHSPDVTCR